MGKYTLWNARDLAFMRAVQNDNFPDVCTIDEPVMVKDGMGGYSNTWNTLYLDEPCRMWISSGTSGTSEESRHWGEREVNFTEAFIVLRWDININDKCRITWTHSETGTVREFKIVGLNKHDSITTATRCRVEGFRANG